MRRRIVALLILALVPLLVLVSPRVGAQEPTATPSQGAAQDTPSRAPEEDTPTTVATRTSTITAPRATPTPSAIPLTAVPTATPMPPAQVAPPPSPGVVATVSPIPTATPTPLPAAGFLGGIAPLAQANATAAALIGGTCLLAAVILLFAILLRPRRPPARATRPLDPSVPVLQGITVPSLKFYLEREQMTIGRAPNCDFRIPDGVEGIDAISRQHARFEKRGLRWAVIDGARDGELSSNGVFVNGKRTLENYLTDDDEVGFGDVSFRFHAPPANAQSAEGNPR